MVSCIVVNENYGSEGDKAQQRIVLREVLMEDPKDVEAWYQLALLLSEPERIQYCLEHVLQIDPQHAGARQWLKKIQVGEETAVDELPGESIEWKDPRCPHVGLMDDPLSLMSYPSPGNCCHRTAEVLSVEIEHQRVFCLAEAHLRCPVFLGRELAAQGSDSKKPVFNPIAIIKRARI